MVSSSDALSVLKPVFDGVRNGLAMLWGFLNMIFKPVEMLFQMVLEFTDRGMAIQWVVDLFLAIGAIIFVYMTRTDNVGKGEGVEIDKEFQLSEFSARSGVFISSVGLLLTTTSALLGRVFDMSAVRNVVGEIKLTFSSEYDAYLATFKHGLHSLLLVAVSFLWGLSDDRVTLWSFTNATDAPVSDIGLPISDSGTTVYLTVLFVVLLVSKFFSEGRHGEDAREMVSRKGPDVVLGTTVDLRQDHQFKHARGSALTVSTGLLVYYIVNVGGSQGFFEFLGNSRLALSLGIYILVVALERIVGPTEWVYGGAGGLVVTGTVSTLNLIFAGLSLAENKDTTALVVVLGVIFLDAMRVGYGQAVPEIGVVSDTRKVFLRLAQAVIGILMFRYVQTATGAPVLLVGVATASSLIKIVGVTYIGKDLYKTSTEHHYRELASTGLVLASAYLWTREESTESIVYFVLAVVSRFLDSIMDFLMSGMDALSYITWDKSGEGVDSPSSDNPRTWLTLLGLIVSLTMAVMVMHDQSRPTNKVLSDSTNVAVTFISVHLAVVVIGLLSDIPGAEGASILALSRSKIVRFSVTTTVLCSLAVAAGELMREGDMTQGGSSDGVFSHLVSALVAYMFTDVVGRELL